MIRAFRIATRDPLRVPSLVAGRVREAGRTRLDRSIVTGILSRLQRGRADRDRWHAHQIESPRWDRTGVTTVLVGPGEGPPQLAIKLPHTDAGTTSLRHQQEVQAQLHGDPRLCDWIALVPRAVGEGRIWRRRYFIESVVPGRIALPTDTDDTEPGVAMARRTAMATTIGDLHRLTAARIQVDGTVLDRWVDRPIRVLSRARLSLGDPNTKAEALARLRRRLTGALDGRQLQVSWVHGDFWRGNVLFAADGITPTGIVDWDRAGPAELPWHDLFHLLLYPRREVDGAGASKIVALLRGQRIWRDDELALFETARQALADDGIDDGVMALLYWLRHTAATMTLYPRSSRDRVYLSADVEPVLQAVATMDGR